MTIKFENIYECEKISSNLLFENIYEYEKISSNLLFENIIKFVIWKYHQICFFGFLVAFICELVKHLWIWKNIIKFEKIFMNSKSAHEI